MDQNAIADARHRLVSNQGKHKKTKAIVKVLLAHQGLELQVINDEWRLICQCEDSVPAVGKLFASVEAQSEWHAKHIAKVMREKGMIR